MIEFLPLIVIGLGFAAALALRLRYQNWLKNVNKFLIVSLLGSFSSVCFFTFLFWLAGRLNYTVVVDVVFFLISTAGVFAFTVFLVLLGYLIGRLVAAPLARLMGEVDK